MNPVLRKISDALKENEKELLIGKSGSTRQSSNERIRSGQSYLYKLHGMESEILEIRFVKNVRGDHLNRALSEAMKRYPYFNTKLIEKDGDFFIVQNDLSLVARKTDQFAELGGIGCGYHLIDVTYRGNSLYVSFHHALCDGRGIKPFVETLIWYYCNFAYGAVRKADGIRYAGDPLLDGETEDPFMHTYAYDETKQFVSLPRDAFHLPENAPSGEKINYRYEVRIPHSRFMAACRENNATPVILLSLLMSGGIAALYPDYDRPINANIATDMREALGYPNTYKNCVKSMILPYDRAIAQLPLKEQTTKYREILNAQRDYDYCRREADSMLQIFDRLDCLHSYEEKRGVMAFFEGMTLDTYIVSYLGSLVLGENERWVQSAHLYNSGTTGLGINMISCGAYFVLDFKQNFKADQYVKAFLRQLDEIRVDYTASDAIAFFTPTDRLLKRKNLRDKEKGAGVS